MRQVLFGIFSVFGVLVLISFRGMETFLEEIPVDSLRSYYEKSPDLWPKPNVDANVKYTELGVVPASPVDLKIPANKAKAVLGKLLFFDPRLSESNQISCSSCHAPDLHYADGREVSIGHDHAPNKRNAPSLENVWFFKKLFWDGRVESLEDQAQGPLSSSTEMHQDMKLLPQKISKISGYKPYFAAAFGNENISAKHIFESLAVFQRTIVSRKAAFDRFLEGNKKALTDQQILGLHLFRTKARCVNCHNGPLFSDGEFHNLGLTYYGRKYEDLGRYNITKKAEDVGKFKTPGLRNVMRTAPWFHNGLFGNMDGVMNMYNVGMPNQKRKPEEANDPLYPANDKLLRGLMLSNNEKAAVISFLDAISTEPWKDRAPELPQ
ncbi:MAG: cytochrome c peroxidase [Bacteroidota bacterium]